MKNIGLLFPGQGSQYIGMCNDFYNKYDVVRKVFEEASDNLHFDLKKLCFDGDLKELSLTKNTQPALLTVSYAMFKVFMDKYKKKPDYLLGHSLGELSALTCSGAIKFADAIKIVRTRGELMQNASDNCNGAMAAVIGLSVNEIEKVIEELKLSRSIINIACYNSSRENVISGEVNAINEAVKKLEEKAEKVKLLNVSGGFHTDLMKDAAEKFEEELLKYKFKEFNIPVISNVDALPYNSPSEIVSKLKQQLTSPVLWTSSVEYLKENNVQCCVEIGPKATLSKLVKKNDKSFKAFSFDNYAEINNIDEILLNNDQMQPKNLSFIGSCLLIGTCAKNNNLDIQEYNQGVVQPIESIRKMYRDIKNENREASSNEMHECLEKVLLILSTKKVSPNESVQRLKKLINETADEEIITEINKQIYNTII